MIEKPKTSYAKNCVHRTEDDVVTDQKAQPCVVGGMLFIPADNLIVGETSDLQRGTCFVRLLIARGQAGLKQDYTPEGARDIANALNSAADAAEAHVAKLASAAIDSARKNGGAE